MSEQKAQDGLVTAAWLGARRVEGVAGGRHEASDRGRERKIRKTKAPFMEGGLFCFNKPLVCCDFIQVRINDGELKISKAIYWAYKKPCDVTEIC